MIDKGEELPMIRRYELADLLLWIGYREQKLDLPIPKSRDWRCFYAGP